MDEGVGVGGGLNTAHKLFKFLSVTFSHEKSHDHLISLKREYHENTLVFFFVIHTLRLNARRCQNIKLKKV